jgi:hypothetical protein
MMVDASRAGVISLHKLECAAFRCIEWDSLIADLERSRWPVTRIAEAINVPRTTVLGWKHCAKEPRYSAGYALLLLHRKVFGDAWTQKSLETFRARAIKQPATG